MFQSTRPRGARQHKGVQADTSQGFNPRAHAGRDFTFYRALMIYARFNPRAHAGRDLRRSRHSWGQCCFNPRAHAGRDNQRPKRQHGFTVSIHAPTRGATTRPGNRGRLIWFQSTRPRGARLTAFSTFCFFSGFNPRAHAGRDPPIGGLCALNKSFNPRAHAGRDAAKKAN